MTWKLKSPKGVEGVFPNLGCSGSVPVLQLPSNSFPAACGTDVSRSVSRVVPFVWMCAFCCLTCWLCVSSARLSSSQTSKWRNVKGRKRPHRGRPWEGVDWLREGEGGGWHAIPLSNPSWPWQTNTTWAKGDVAPIVMHGPKGVHVHAWARVRMCSPQQMQTRLRVEIPPPSHP